MARKTTAHPLIIAAALMQSSAFASDVLNTQDADQIQVSNADVLGDAPGMAMGSLYAATDQALSNAAHNATSAQQNANTILQATPTQGVSLVIGGDSDQGVLISPDETAE